MRSSSSIIIRFIPSGGPVSQVHLTYLSICMGRERRKWENLESGLPTYLSNNLGVFFFSSPC